MSFDIGVFKISQLKMWRLVLVLSLALHATWAALVVKIDTTHVINTLDERYLSVTMDQSSLALIPKFGTFDFKSTQIRTLLRGLSPAYFRYGGTSADYAVFSEADPQEFLTTGTKPVMYAMAKKDWDNFVNLTLDTGMRFLYEFSLQLRYGMQWDPSNAIELLEYLTSKGYGENIDFEMGNEPNIYVAHPDWAVLTGKRIAEDYNILKTVISKYPAFKKSILVGPDTGTVDQMYNDFVHYYANSLSAATWHHYYFLGIGASYKEYLKAEHFDTLKSHIENSLSAVKNSSNPDLPVWLGETSDAYGGGTLNVSDKFVSGFLWMDKLGLSASMGLKAVFRQTFFGHNYPLVGNDSYPNPDYWLSYAYKQLVGLKVLNTNLQDFSEGQAPPTLRVYAHCTRPSKIYSMGAVTIYGLNVNETAAVKFSTTGALANLAIDQYLMQAMGQDGVLSRYTLLNGKHLELVDEDTLPELTPTKMRAGSPIILPPSSYGFFVIPDAKIQACMS